MSFWIGDKTGEWTIVVTSKASMVTSCIVLYGTSLRVMKPQDQLQQKKAKSIDI